MSAEPSNDSRAAGGRLHPSCSPDWKRVEIAKRFLPPSTVVDRAMRKLDNRRIGRDRQRLISLILAYENPMPCDACGGTGGKRSANSGSIPHHCAACDGFGVEANAPSQA